MTKAEFDADRRRRSYPVKKKGKKFNPGHDHITLENEIMKLENEKAELRARLEEKTQLCIDLENAIKSERAMTEMVQKELGERRKTARITYVLSAVGVVIGIIGLVLCFK